MTNVIIISFGGILKRKTRWLGVEGVKSETIIVGEELKEPLDRRDVDVSMIILETLRFRQWKIWLIEGNKIIKLASTFVCVKVAEFKLKGYFSRRRLISTLLTLCKKIIGRVLL